MRLYNARYQARQVRGLLELLDLSIGRVVTAAAQGAPFPFPLQSVADFLLARCGVQANTCKLDC